MLKNLVAATAAMVLSLVSVCNAHMIMSSPVPYGKSTLDNSPLLADGSDFPCKQRSGVYDLEGAENNLVIGEPNTLSFIGSVVHGGGSCQVSLTKDLQPTVDSTWMVIHSIEGNCPSNVTGNLPEDASGTGAAVFQYTIPEGIEPGQYTIAWSWTSKLTIEYYMNCGPATISAPQQKRYAPLPKVRRQTTFPPLFVANLEGVSDCRSSGGVDIIFPDPGDSVETGSISVNLQTPICTGSTVTLVSSASSPGTSVAISATPSTSASGFATDTPASSFASVAPAESTSTATVSPIPEASVTAETSTTDPSAITSAASAPSSSSSGTTTTGTQSGACSDEGAWYCLADGNSFQRCASGEWSAVMPMPAGTTCTPGESDTLTMNAAQRRSQPFFA